MEKQKYTHSERRSYPDRRYDRAGHSGRASSYNQKRYDRNDDTGRRNNAGRKHFGQNSPGNTGYAKRFEDDDRRHRSNTNRSYSSDKPFYRDFHDRKTFSHARPSLRQKSAAGNRQTGSDKIDIRLNKYIANSGICSRREADDLIIQGYISVNGKTVTELGSKISIHDTVKYKEKTLSIEHKVYILMNKPKGYVTTVDDPHAEHTVIELLGDNIKERVYPVGRLDKDTTGVLLLTNDGDLTKKLTHPKYERMKIYHVFLNRNLIKDDLFKLTEGVEIEEGVVVSADAASFPDIDDKTQVGIEIHSGQNHIVKRMFETLGYRVKKLDRVYFAGLTKKNVQRGKWRFLSDKEIIMLKRGIF